MLEIWLVVLIVALVTLALWAYFTAQRLNWLHIRTDAARASLQSMLDRRAAVAVALIPEAADAARRAEAIVLDYGNFERRASVEREVTAAIESRPDTPPELVDAGVRVELAHRFYNEAVADTRALRTRLPVRLLRLGGTAALPEFFDF